MKYYYVVTFLMLPEIHTTRHSASLASTGNLYSWDSTVLMFLEFKLILFVERKRNMVIIYNYNNAWFMW